MKIHKLKLNAKYYEDSERGIKTFEIRKNDRVYKIGDVLELREYIEDIRGLGCYTGNVHWKIITYILDDDLYLAPGYVCLGLSPIAEPGQEDRRMSDVLISRKAVIESVDRHTRDDGTLDDDISVILEEVETAFDKEKVIKELKANMSSVQGISGQAVTFMFSDGYYNGTKDAIEIVEKGGIE